MLWVGRLNGLEVDNWVCPSIFFQYLFALALILKKNVLFLDCTGAIENVWLNYYNVFIINSKWNGVIIITKFLG